MCSNVSQIGFYILGLVRRTFFSLVFNLCDCGLCHVLAKLWQLLQPCRAKKLFGSMGKYSLNWQGDKGRPECCGNSSSSLSCIGSPQSHKSSASGCQEPHEELFHRLPHFLKLNKMWHFTDLLIRTRTLLVVDAKLWYRYFKLIQIQIKTDFWSL